jgi:hypothetical protein
MVNEPDQQPKDDFTAQDFNISLSPEVYGVLKKIADDKGKSVTQVLGHAIALEKEAADANRIVVRKGGKDYIVSIDE